MIILIWTGVIKFNKLWWKNNRNTQSETQIENRDYVQSRYSSQLNHPTLTNNPEVESGNINYENIHNHSIPSSSNISIINRHEIEDKPPSYDESVMKHKNPKRLFGIGVRKQ